MSSAFKKIIMMANQAPEVDTSKYLTMVALEDGFTAQLSVNACQYSFDCVDWVDLSAATATPAINAGDKIYFKATGLTPTSSAGIGTFSTSKKFNLEGNCNSMLFGDEADVKLSLAVYSNAFYNLFYNSITLQSVSRTFLPATTLAYRCYCSMFRGCTLLTTTPELPATTLGGSCYQYMFRGCTLLTTTPELPATKLAGTCYASMFTDCTSLTTAPELPATKLVGYCYANMFYGCSSLTTAPKLPATTLASYCCSQMFYGCRSLTTAPELPATKLADNCYRSMFQGCRSLTVVPELPATTLATQCYYNMFYNCRNLNYIKMLATDITATDCLTSWVYGVSLAGTFVKNAAMISLPTGVSGIPTGWTVEDYTP